MQALRSKLADQDEGFGAQSKRLAKIEALLKKVNDEGDEMALDDDDYTGDPDYTYESSSAHDSAGSMEDDEDMKISDSSSNSDAEGEKQREELKQTGLIVEWERDGKIVDAFDGRYEAFLDQIFPMICNKVKVNWVMMHEEKPM